VAYLGLCAISVLAYLVTHLDIIGIEIFNWRIALTSGDPGAVV
jgi:hypothetical protein